MITTKDRLFGSRVHCGARRILDEALDKPFIPGQTKQILEAHILEMAQDQAYNLGLDPRQVAGPAVACVLAAVTVDGCDWDDLP